MVLLKKLLKDAWMNQIYIYWTSCKLYNVMIFRYLILQLSSENRATTVISGDDWYFSTLH